MTYKMVYFNWIVSKCLVFVDGLEFENKLDVNKF